MHNIYRIDNGQWNTFTKVVFPDGQVMDEDNHDFERDGFFWCDEPPTEYIKWYEDNNINLTAQADWNDLI